MQLQVKLGKTAEMTYLKATKEIGTSFLTYLQVPKYEKKVRLRVCRPQATMKGKCYVFGSYKQRNQVRFVYLECKLQEDTHG